MVWKKIRNLLFGLFCSALILGLMILNCIYQEQVTAIARSDIPFPYKMHDQPLVIHSITGYEGTYMEDGSEREVTDVAAILVENVGENMLSHANIALYSESECFLFYAQSLPPGEKTVLLEKNQQIFIDQKVTSCWASAQYASCNDLQERFVHVRVIGMDALELSNMTDRPIYDLNIYHKTWSKEIGAYLGGICYVTHVEKLEPGQLVLVKPNHYAYGYSRIICITSAGLSL